MISATPTFSFPGDKSALFWGAPGRECKCHTLTTQGAPPGLSCVWILEGMGLWLLLNILQAPNIPFQDVHLKEIQSEKTLRCRGL